MPSPVLILMEDSQSREILDLFHRNWSVEEIVEQMVRVDRPVSRLQVETVIRDRSRDVQQQMAEIKSQSFLIQYEQIRRSMKLLQEAQEKRNAAALADGRTRTGRNATPSAINLAEMREMREQLDMLARLLGTYAPTKSQSVAPEKLDPEAINERLRQLGVPESDLIVIPKRPGIEDD